MIKQISGEILVRPYLKAASETFEINDVVTKNSSGLITKATTDTPRANLIGQIQRSVATTDADYATSVMVNIAVFACCEEKEFEATVDTGTAVQAMVNKAVDLNDENGVNVNSNKEAHFKITRIISTTKVRGYFLTAAQTNFVMKAYSQVCPVASFTDGGSTAGTLALSVSIPAGAVYAQTLLSNLVGFAGDTSAVIVVGDGTDVDRYNTGTPSVFATADGADAGIPSGTKYHSGAKTPTVTITSASDFTAVISNGLGSVKVTMLWYEAI